MKGSLLSRFFTLGGAITVKRTWNPDNKLKRKGLDPSDTRKIERALQENWVITFPQGTTKPFAPGRKGTALIIKRNKPVVVPVVINGFWRAFNKNRITSYNVCYTKLLRIRMNGFRKRAKILRYPALPVKVSQRTARNNFV